MATVSQASNQTTLAPIRLAIIGCGAIAEFGHLPAATSCKAVEVVALVDKNRERAEAMAKQFGIKRVAEDPQRLTEAEAAIVALPNHLHAPVSIGLLRRGIHVLVEKPMAMTVAECDFMIQAAEEGRARLAVGLMRRFQRGACLMKAAIESGMLGQIESFDLRDGFVYGWPSKTDSFLRKEFAGGGVLIDFGSHGLDSILWWLGDVAEVEYYDDGFGGVEADCEVRLTMKRGAQGVAEFSRTRNLRRTAIVRGEYATLEIGLHSDRVTLVPHGTSLRATGEVWASKQPDETPQTTVAWMAAQLDEFARAIREGCLPRVPGSEGRRSVNLIDACYRQRKPLSLPWLAPLSQATS